MFKLKLNVMKRIQSTPSERAIWVDAFKIVKFFCYFPGEEAPCIGYIGMCSLKGYGFFSALLVKKWSVDFGHFGLK